MEAAFSKRLKWRGEAAAHSVLGAALRLLPVESVFVFGEFLGKLIWPLMKGRQSIIKRNLRIALDGGLDPAEIEILARNSFILTVANMLCSAVCAKAPGVELAGMIEVENPEVLTQALAKGNGVVLLLAHMGNWELLTRLRSFLPQIENLGGFYRPLNNPILNERVLREREADGSRLFSKRDSLHHVTGFLRENGVVGILADQRVGRQGELVEFFGRLTRASPLPGLLARRCRSEVVALSLRTIAPGKWSARFHVVEKPYNSANCMQALESAMNVSVTDVFWLQERWKVYLAKRTSPSEWIGDADARSNKPHRALIWAKESEKDLTLPPPCLHGDIVYEKVVGKEPCDLVGLDEAAALPIDFILAFSKNEDLRSRAKELGIPVFPVSYFLK